MLLCLYPLGLILAYSNIFGLYPAIKAARKNPIDSLKFYR